MGRDWCRKLIMYSAMLTLLKDPRYFERSADDVIPEPNSCAVCGYHYAKTGMYYSESIGYHVWIEPTNELRLRRMKARREIVLSRTK